MSPCLADNWKLPSKLVIVPVVVPFTTTLAPITGSPVVSFTIPLTANLLSKCVNGQEYSSYKHKQDLEHKVSFFHVFVFKVNCKISYSFSLKKYLLKTFSSSSFLVLENTLFFTE